jgi:hypothetical protein
LKRIEEGTTTNVEENGVDVGDDVLLQCSPSEDRNVSISQACLREIGIGMEIGRWGVLWFGIDGSWNHRCLLSLCDRGFGSPEDQVRVIYVRPFLYFF